ncbi:MAG: sigma-54-dependent Fis family transcriptional regulator, partial [Armatimonadetes bacterium]|nr:sigma-54-dependent Fis family transcriptional regulator [Armatimonadota bacterium]
LTLMVPKQIIDAEDLPPNIRGAEAAEIRFPLGVRMDVAEREIIRRTLETTPTIKEAAKVLGIGLRTLHTKIRNYKLR